MEIIRKGVGTPNLITSNGPEELETILPARQGSGLKFSLVRFKNGGRTNWHRHPGEQILYILEGEGRAGNETQEWADLKPGDLIYAAPGEKHWHGAMPACSLTHISIITVGAPEWFGPVE